MKCINCQGEWTPPANQSLSKCPFCQTDIIQMLNVQAEVLSTEVILANMLQAYGTDLLQNQQRLSAMISDLFAHDHKTKRLLLLSVRENIPSKLSYLSFFFNKELSLQLNVIQHYFEESAFIKAQIVEQILSLWVNSLIIYHEKSIEILEEKESFSLLNSNGEMIASLNYIFVGSFKNGLAQVINNKGRKGFINNSGDLVVDINVDNVDNVDDYSEGFAPISIRNREGFKYGFIDKVGNPICEFIYDDVKPFKKGLAIVWKKDDKDSYYGIINKNGKVIVEVIYDRIEFYNDLFIAQLNGKFGCLDTDGKIKLPFDYYYIYEFSEGMAWVENNKKWGFIDNQCKFIVDFIYDSADSFKNGLSLVELGNKKYFINKEGVQVINLEYDRAFSFNENMARVEINNKFGFIDITGKLVIPIIYDSACDFSGGIAKVKMAGKYGFIDQNQNNLIPIIYDQIISYDKYDYGGVNCFKHGLTTVKLNNKFGCVNKLGKVIIPIIYDELTFSVYLNTVDLICAKIGNKYGYINKNGTVIIPIIYDSASEFGPYTCVVTLKEKHYWLNSRGDEVGFKVIIGC